jgi:outer membrane murein-binding lipoprotein Lpp
MDDQSVQPIISKPSQPEPVVNQSQPPLGKPKRSMKLPLLAILIVVLLAGAIFGTYDWQHRKVSSSNAKVASLQSQLSSLQSQVNKLSSKTASPKSSSTAATPNPYAGWGSYTLKQEKLSFKYPSSWTLKDMSDSNDDYVLLNGTNGYEMEIGAGSAISAISNPSANCIAQADKVTFNNQPAYLDLETVAQSTSSCTPVSSPPTIDRILLSDSSQDTAHNNFFPTKNLTTGSSPAIIVNIDYDGPSFTNPHNNKTVSFIENDVNYMDAKLVVDSMSY